MKQLLITGANSYVGTEVERWLMREPERYQVDTLDMIDDSWRQKDFSGYDVVFHVAGIAHIKTKKSMSTFIHKVNSDLAIETAKRSKACNVKQFIFMSSMSVYGTNRSLKLVVITKDTQTAPDGLYGDSKLQAEIGIRMLEDENFKVAILRPPMIYGPRSKGNFPKLVTLASKTPIFPAYHNKRSMLYIENFCEFVKLVIDNDSQGIFWPQNIEYVDTVEVVIRVATVFNNRVFINRLFNPMVTLGSFFFQQVNKLFGNYIYTKGISQSFDNKYNVVDFKTSLLRTIKYHMGK